MKRVLWILLVLLLPLSAFAQSTAPNAQQKALKQLGLNDTQVSKVMDIQGKTRTTVQADRVQLRLLRAQLDKALLPANPDMQAVNGIIGQIGQTRVDLQKTLVAARVQLRQIMGDDTFRAYMRHLRRTAWMAGERRLRMERMRGDFMDGRTQADSMTSNLES